jgi:polar amino acid transport system substrate-binding protein
MLDKLLAILKKCPPPVSWIGELVSVILDTFGRVATVSLMVGVLLGLLASSFLLWKGYYPFAGKLFVRLNDYDTAQKMIAAQEQQIADLKRADEAGSANSEIEPKTPNGDVIIDYKGRVTFTWTDSKKDRSDYTIVVRQRLGNGNQASLAKEFKYSKKDGYCVWTVTFKDQDMPFGEYFWTVKPTGSDSDTSIYRLFSVYPSTLGKIKSLGTLVVGTSLIPDPLFFHVDENGKPTGYEPQLVDLVKQRLSGNVGDVEVKFRYLSWNDLLPKLHSHEIDMVVSSMTKTKPREKAEDVLFSTGYYTTHQRFVVHVPNQGTTPCLVNERIGVVSGEPRTTNEIAAGMLKNSYGFTDIKGYKSAPELFMALDSGDVDAALVDDISAKENYKENESAEFFGPDLDEALNSLNFYDTTIGYPKEEYAIAVSTVSKDLLDIVDDALAAARGNGTLERLSRALVLGGLKRTSSVPLC